MSRESFERGKGGCPSPCAYGGDSVVNVDEGIGSGVKARSKPGWSETRGQEMKEECYQVQLGRSCWTLQALFKILTFIPRQEVTTEGF